MLMAEKNAPLARMKDSMSTSVMAISRPVSLYCFVART